MELKGIFGMFKRKAVVQQTTAKNLFDGLRGWFSQRRQYTDIVASFKGWAFACIQKRADAVAALEWQITVNGKEVNEKHWLYQLFRNPSEIHTRYELFETISKSLDVYGNAYLYTPIASKYPISLELIPSNSVQLVVENGTVAKYLVSLAAGMKTLTPDEVCHLRTLQPKGEQYSSYLGEPLINAAIDTIHADSSIVNYVKTYYQNDALPPLVITTQDEITLEQGERMKRLWNENLPNHIIATILENGVDVKPITSGGVGSSSKLDVSQLDQDSLTKIAAVFGLSRGKITGDHQNKATADVNDYSFRVDTIEPMAQRIGEALTKHFRKFDKTVTVEHKRYVYSDETIEIQKAEFEIANGIKTINEIRNAKGLPLIQGGDIPLIKTGLVPLDSLSQLPQETAIKKKSLNLETESEIKAYWDKWNEFTKSYEEDLLKEILKSVGLLEAAVLQDLDVKLAKELVLFDVDEFIKVFGKNVEPKLLAQLKQTIVESIKVLGDNWDGVISDLDKAILKELEESISKVTGSVKTIEKELEEIVAKGKATGKPIADVIENQFKNYYKKDRAKVIAETAGNYTTNAGQKIVFEESGVKRVWTSQRDKRVRPAHQSADGQFADKDGFFHVGGESLKFPCGGASAENNVRCRCYQRPRI